MVDWSVSSANPTSTFGGQVPTWMLLVWGKPSKRWRRFRGFGTRTRGARWNLRVEMGPVQFGECVIEVLSPTQAEVAAETSCPGRLRPNVLSSALLVTWRDCQVVLGADLTRPGWDNVESRRGPEYFATTDGLKISITALRQAQHAVALGSPPPRDRLAVASPFSQGRRVPDFAPGQDVDQLLGLVTQVYLTTHHGPLPPIAKSMIDGLTSRRRQSATSDQYRYLWTTPFSEMLLRVGSLPASPLTVCSLRYNAWLAEHVRRLLDSGCSPRDVLRPYRSVVLANHGGSRWLHATMSACGT